MAVRRCRYRVPPYPFQRHSDASVEAAEAIEHKAPTLQALVLRELREWGGAEGMTDEEIQRGLAMDPSTERPRRIELVRKGLVMDSGRTRRTTSGRQATVWVAVEEK